MKPEPARPEPGEIIAGRYAVRRLINDSRGIRTLVATDVDTYAEVVVKVAPVTSLTPSALTRIEHEALVLRRLESTCIAPLLDSGRDGDSFYLVMPYVKGRTLAERLTSAPLTLHDVVRLGKCLFTALRDAHEEGVLHGDVKPSNIIVSEEHRRATLVDLGLARTRWLDPAIRDLPAGTVRYMSPEQAGIIDVPVDERSDLYSAGAVLFECVVGRPLFRGATLGQVLREHATVGSADPRQFGANVPRAVAEIVMRLLAKEPGERYQSAEAVLADLVEIEGSLERGEREPAVVVGLHDSRRTFAEPAFVGRDTELSSLLAELERTASGRSALVLLEAESGGGKTRLLEEFARGTAGKIAWVLNGQGIDQAAQRPFEVLTGVAAGILRALESNDILARALRERVGERGDAVCAAFPELQTVFGPVTAELGPEAFGEQRTLEALASLLDALGSEGRPAVVLLDDCQWADELALKLLLHRQRHDFGSHTLVVAAFRSEEVGAEHPLRKVERPVRVELSPLEAADIRALAESMAGPLPDPALDVVVQLSEGSPFMASAVVRGLVETGALVEEPAGWSVDPAALADVKASRRAAAFLSRRLRLLPEATLRLLEVGAVLGKEFEGAIAADLAERSSFDAQAALDEARRRHIVWRWEADRWAFVHDKLRESVLDLMDESARRQLHLEAAHLIERRHPERAFDLAYHFDAGGESTRALPYALASAERARSQYALDIAQQQYEIAARVSESTDAATSLRIMEGLGDVLLLRGTYQPAQDALERARTLATDALTRSRVEAKLGDLAFKRGDMQGAGEALERGLHELGRRVPRSPVAFLMAALKEVAIQVAHTLSPRIFCGRRSAEGRDAEFIAIRMLSRLAHVYWFSKGTVATFWAHQREMNLAERYPPTLELAQAYSEHAPALSLVPYYRRGAKYGRRSLEIRKQLNDLWGQGQSLNFLGVLAYSTARFDECIEHCRQAVRLLSRTGDRWEVNIAEVHIALSLYRLGDLRGAVDVAKRVFRTGVEIGDPVARAVSLDAWSKASAGRTPQDLIHPEIERPSIDVQARAEVLQAEAVRLLAQDEPSEAVAVLERARRLCRQAGLRQEFVAPVLPWLATALRTEAESLPSWDRRHRMLLRRARSAAFRARILSFSFRNNRSHALRETGIIAAMSGRARRARRFLRRSVAAAERYGMRYERALTISARERIGRHLGWPAVTAHDADPDELLRAIEPREEEDDLVTPSLIDRFDTVLETGRTIASALTRDAVYAATREAALALLRAERVVVLEAPDDGADDFHAVAGHTLGEFSRTLARRAVDSGRPVLLDEAMSDSSESLVLGGVRSALCAPIFVRGRISACFYAEHRKLAGLFGIDESQLAAFVATVAGAALENAEGFAEIQELTRSLERRVRDRTQELGDTNRRLDESLAQLTEAFDREREMTQRLTQLDQLKTDFMAMTAHDLRSPLTAIAGFAELLAEDWPETQEADRHVMLTNITTAAKRLAEFIDNMLQFARIESGELSYDNHPFDLGALLTNVVAEHAAAAPNSFHVAVEPDLPRAFGDEQRNWQVVTNVLSNAVKFSPADGPIAVAVVPDGGFLRVSVRDEGPGIADADQKRLFQKFERIVSRGKRSAGTGLGLYICRSIVEAQGGRIWVDSAEGEGATFSYTIPVAPKT